MSKEVFEFDLEEENLDEIIDRFRSKLTRALKEDDRYISGDTRRSVDKVLVGLEILGDYATYQKV